MIKCKLFVMRLRGALMVTCLDGFRRGLDKFMENRLSVAASYNGSGLPSDPATV